MAITIPIVTEFRDAGLKSAQREVDTFSGRMQKSFGKVGAYATTAGSVLGAFALKSVMTFQNLALEAGNFADATGIAIEDASRWVDLAGDMGVASGDIEKAILRMNVTLADGGKKFEQLGLQVIRTSNGMVDSNATFQKAVTAIGAIEDPTLRAKAAQEVFGKSYANIARIMELSAGELAERLAEVPETNIFDRKKEAEAKRFQQALEDLKGAAEQLQLEIGEQLVPALSDLAVGILEVNNVALGGVSAGNIFQQGFDNFLDRIGIGGIQDVGAYKQAMEEMIETKRRGGLTVEELANITGYYMSRVQAAASEVRDFTTDLGTLEEATRRLRDRISERQAWKDFRETLFYFKNDMFVSTEEADKFALAIADIIENLDSIDPETKIKLITELEGGELDEVLRKLEILRRGVQIPIRPSPTNIGLPQGMWNVPGLAVGGQAKAGKPYMVGERGPELFVPTGSGRVVPNDQLGGAGMTVNITTSADPNDVIQAIELYRRRNGAALV